MISLQLPQAEAMDYKSHSKISGGDSGGEKWKACKRGNRGKKNGGQKGESYLFSTSKFNGHNQANLKGAVIDDSKYKKSTSQQFNDLYRALLVMAGNTDEYLPGSILSMKNSSAPMRN